MRRASICSSDRARRYDPGEALEIFCACLSGFATMSCCRSIHCKRLHIEPSKSFRVFGPSPLPDSLTLEEALGLKGGGIDALARQAAAALLNSSKEGYGFIEAEVISQFKAAVASESYEATKNSFQEANEAPCS